jgi:hypothetical protein
LGTGLKNGGMDQRSSIPAGDRGKGNTPLAAISLSFLPIKSEDYRAFLTMFKPYNDEYIICRLL